MTIISEAPSRAWLDNPVPQPELGNGGKLVRYQETIDAGLSQVGSTFTFQTDAAKKDYASLRANLTLLSEKKLRVHLNYNAEVVRANHRAHSFNAGLRWEF